jgi:small conductance mechanosensitive channel
MTKRGVDPALISFASSIAYITILIFVIIAAIARLGIQTASFVAIVGAAGLAIGFALQGSLSNFAAGFLIITFKPFKIGDYVEGGGTAGIVEEIQIFTTVLNTPDNKVIIVPNSQMLGGTITNYSAKDTRRVDLVVGVSYGDDLTKVRQILQSIADADSRILKDPAPMIVVGELADSSVNFNYRLWVNTADYWGVYFDTTEAVKKRFDQEGVSIPFPQTDVHLYKQE